MWHDGRRDGRELQERRHLQYAQQARRRQHPSARLRIGGELGQCAKEEGEADAGRQEDRPQRDDRARPGARVLVERDERREERQNKRRAEDRPRVTQDEVGRPALHRRQAENEQCHGQPGDRRRQKQQGHADGVDQGEVSGGAPGGHTP